MKDKTNFSNYDGKVFNAENFKYINDPIAVIVDSIAILVGDYEPARKQAAMLLLKALLKDNFLKDLLKDIENEKTERAKKSCEA